MPIKDHQGTLPLQVAHETRDTVLGRDGDQQLDVIDHGAPLNDFDPLPFAQIFQDLHDAFFILVVDYLAAILRGEHDMLFTHPPGMC